MPERTYCEPRTLDSHYQTLIAHDLLSMEGYQQRLQYLQKINVTTDDAAEAFAKETTVTELDHFRSWLQDREQELVVALYFECGSDVRVTPESIAIFAKTKDLLRLRDLRTHRRLVEDAIHLKNDVVED